MVRTCVTWDVLLVLLNPPQDLTSCRAGARPGHPISGLAHRSKPQSARLKAQGPRTFATTSSERDDGFCKMTPKRQLGQPSLSPYGHPRAAVPQYRRDITWRNDHEKAQYAWDRRWCRVISCGALLASMVPRECGPCGATANVVTC